MNAKMEPNRTQNRRLTWEKTGWLTLAVLLVSVLIGARLMRQRIFLAPPLAASTTYFYLAIGYCRR